MKCMYIPITYVHGLFYNNIKTLWSNYKLVINLLLMYFLALADTQIFYYISPPLTAKFMYVLYVSKLPANQSRSNHWKG